KKPLHATTGAVRLLNAHASGTPRLVFELYGQHGLLYDYGVDGGWERGDSLRAAAARWCGAFGWESVSTMGRAGAADPERSGSRVLAGSPPDHAVIRVGSLLFRVEPRHPRNVGLFLDTRALRDDLAERARDGGAR